MSDFDVLIIGGYSLTEKGGGDLKTRNKIRLSYNNHLASLDFIKYLVNNNGDLDLTEKQYLENNKSRLVARSLNTIYLTDFLTKNNIRTQAVNYFLLEQNKFKELMNQKPKVIIISTTFISDAIDTVAIAKTAKEISPNSTVIVGGIKILKSFKSYTLFHKNYFDGFDIESLSKNDFFFDPDIDKHIDIFVIEECGELTLLELIKRIQSGEDFRSTPNIAFYEKDKLTFTNKVKEPYTFENNFISWDKIPASIIGQQIPVRAGIGCPFKCAFCDFTGLHKVKIRTIDNLIEELRLINKTYPNCTVFFTDDNLFTTSKRTKELSEAILKDGLRFKWRGFFRVDAISEDNVQVMAKSGCVSCMLGVESGDENILKNMNKKATREQVLKAIKLLNQNGISTLSTIIIGFPGETKESVDQTISLLNSYPDIKLPINQYYPFVFIYPPLAPITAPDNRKKYKLKGGYEKWSHSTMDSEEAKEQLVRCFQEIRVPTLQYPEFVDPEIPFHKMNDLFKARDGFAKESINIINKDNVSKICETFKIILI